MKVTVQDVAKKAGISTATVDRVLNNRKGVRQQTINKVHYAVKQLGYEPNRLASRLGKAKHYNLCFLLPSGDNSFIKSIKKSIATLQNHYRTENINIIQKDIDLWCDDYEQQVLKLTESADGVAIVAADRHLITKTITNLSKYKPITTLVSDAPNSNRIDYVGIDNVAAGRTAAGLLGRFMAKEPANVALIMGSMELRDHMERRIGFEQIIHRDYPYLTLLPPLICYDDYKQVEQQLIALIKEKSILSNNEIKNEIKGIYSLGGGNRGLIAVLEKTNINPIVVAHELTNTSKAALLSGVFDAVLAQDPLEEVKQSIRLLINSLERPTEPPKKQRIAIDIYMQDNLII